MGRGKYSEDIDELVRLISELDPAESGSEDFPTTGNRLSNSIQACVDRVLGAATNEMRTLVTTAAAIGNNVPIVLVSEVCGMSLEETTGLLDSSALQPMFRISGDPSVEICFSHASIRNAILAEMQSTEKTRIRARAASLLEQQGIAVHHSEMRLFVRLLADTLSECGTSKCIRYARLYAEDKLQDLDPDNAHAMLQYVTCRIEESAEPWAPEDVANLHMLLGRAAYERGELRTAEKAVTRSFDLYVSAGDAAGACDAATMRIYDGGKRHSINSLPWSWGEPSLILRAKKLVEPDSVLYGWLLVGASRRNNEYDAALKIAQERGDEKLKSAALARLAYVENTVAGTYRDFYDELVLKCERTIDHARSSGGADSEFSARMIAHEAYLSLGKTGAAWENAVDAVEIAKTLHRSSLAAAYASLAIVHALRGNWDDSSSAAERCFALTPYGSVSNARLAALDALAVGEYQVGNWTRREEHEQLLRAHGAVREIGLWCAASIPLICSIIDDPEYLKKGMRGLVWGDWRRFAVNPNFIRFNVNAYRASVSLAAYLQNDRKRAELLLEVMGHQRGLSVGSQAYAVSADRLIGLLLIVLDRLDEAVESLREAIEFSDRAGSWPDHAWAQYELAQALIHRSRGDDRSVAKKALQAGRATALTYEMKPLVEKIDAAIEMLSADRERPDNLTDREIEVLACVARGLTNREIGETLYISEHTAATHAQRIRRKTGMANRAELAAYAFRHDILD